jgi:hypothetical protein
MNSQQDVSAKEAFCPESTLESANRRNFIRKAALVTTAAGLGSVVLGTGVKALPESTARSQCCVFYCCPTGYAVWGQTCSGRGVFGKAKTSGAGIVGASCSGLAVWGAAKNPLVAMFENETEVSGADGSAYAQFQTSCVCCATFNWNIGLAGRNNAHSIPEGSFVIENATAAAAPSIVINGTGVGIGIKTPSFPLCVTSASTCAIHGNTCASGRAGVYGSSRASNGAGVLGFSCLGVAVEGISYCANGVVGFAADSGYLSSISTSRCTRFAIQAISEQPLIGMFKRVGCSGDRSAIVQFANSDSTPVDWNLGVAGKCNSIKVPDGFFYVQHSTSTTPGISVNKCNHVGIGLANPCRVLCVNGRIHTSCGMGLGTQTINTTLAINGSLSMKSRQVSSTPVTLTLSDFAVLADAASQNIAITLPSIASTAAACNGMILFIKKSDSSAHTVTITPGSTDQIEGASSKVLTKQWDSLTLISNNSSSPHQWVVLGGSIGDAFIS